MYLLCLELVGCYNSVIVLTIVCALRQNIVSSLQVKNVETCIHVVFQTLIVDP